jgi:hypothetical protein
MSGGVDRIVKLPPSTFLHVQDTNTSVTRVVVGPARVVCLAHERVTLGPSPLIVLKPNESVEIRDPALRDRDGKPLLDKDGQVKLRYGHTEIRFSGGEIEIVLLFLNFLNFLPFSRAVSCVAG